MSGKNKILFRGVYVILFLLLATMALAKEDFIAASQKQALLFCGCSTESDIITIKNAGTLASSYTLSLKGSAADWATAAPSSFSLVPGETKNVYTYVTPPCDVKGGYDLSIYITTSNGLTKVLNQEVSIRNCRNIYLASETPVQKACQCTPVTFDVKIGNIGAYIETYELSVDKSIEEYVLFSENPLVILPGGSKNFFVSAIMPCDILNQQDILLTAKAKNSGFISKLPLKLDIAACYNFDLVAGDYINSIFVPSAENAPYEVCENTKKSIPIRIVNRDVANTYDLSLIGPEWAALSANRISITGKEGIFKIDVAPPSSGLFNITADVISQKGAVSKKKSVYVKSGACYAAEIIASKKINTNYSGTTAEIGIKNTGLKKADYILGIEGPNWITLEQHTLALNPGEAKKVLMKIEPDAEAGEGIYNILIKTTIAETGQAYSSEIKVQLMEKSFIDRYLQEKYIELSPLILIFLAGLIFIIVFLARLPPKEKPAAEIKKIEKKPEKAKQKKEEKIKPKAKIKMSPKLLKKYLLTAAVIIALATIILVSSFTDVIPKFINATKINLTEVPAETTPLPEKPETKPLNLTGIIGPVKGIIGPVKGWLSFYKYYFLAGAILLVIIVVVLSQMAKKPKKKREIERPKKAEIKEKIEKRAEKEKAEKEEKIIPEERVPKNLKWLWWLIALIVLAGIGYIIYRYYSRLKDLAVQYPVAITIKEIAITYMYYILAGIIILIAFIIILSRGKKETAKEERPNYLSYVLGLIVLAIVVLAVYYLIKFVIIPYWGYIVAGIAFLILIFILLAILKKIKAKTSEEKSWAEVNPESDIKLEIENRRIAFGELSLRTKTRLDNVKIAFKKLSKRPTFLSAAGIVYEYFELERENIKNANIKSGFIRFRVKKSWLDNSQIGQDEIFLKNYTNRWVTANTKAVDSDSNYVYYEAEVNRLGYFAVVVKPKKAGQEEKPVPKWPFVILLILLIIAGAYLYYYYTAPAEETTAQREPILKKEFVTQVLDEDTSLAIDLSKYFIDPDNDKLKFTSTKPEHINVIISGSIVTLTPKPNWYGTEYIVFTADDSKGGIVSTPKVTISVQDVPEQMIFKKIQGWFSNTLKSAKGYFSGYLSYILYGLIALVILILVIRYNRAILDFFLEDEEKKKEKKRKID